MWLCDGQVSAIWFAPVSGGGVYVPTRLKSNYLAVRRDSRINRSTLQPIDLRNEMQRRMCRQWFRVGDEAWDWRAEEGCLRFEILLKPGETALVDIDSSVATSHRYPANGLYYRAGVMLRRYLCEVRDNLRLRRSYSS
jgi:hypothetical protein